LWARALSSEGKDIISDVEVNAEGQIVVSGEYRGAAQFMGQNLQHDSHADGFLALLDGNGNLIFSKNSTNTLNADFEKVTFLENGNILAVGDFRDRVTLGDSTLIQNWECLLMAQYSPGGNLIWTKKSGFSSYVTPFTVKGLSGGGFAFTGTFMGTLNLGGNNLVSNGGTDVFLIKMDDQGIRIWSRSFGGPGTEDGFDLTVNEAGEIFSSSCFSSTLSLGGNTYTSNGLWDICITKWEGDGQLQWTQTFGGPENERNNGISVDNQGNV
jgi:hypothetical protein